MNRQQKIKLITFIYLIVSVASIIFWDNNSSKYTHTKGEDFSILIDFLLILTITFALILVFFFGRKFWLIVLLPLITLLTTFALGLGILFLMNLSGSPSELINVYGFTYVITNAFLWLLILLKLKNEVGNAHHRYK